MELVTKYTKGRAETEIVLGTVSATYPDEGEGIRTVRIVTAKDERIKGLSTTASAGVNYTCTMGDRTYTSRQTAVGMGGGGDYYRTLEKTPNIRCTDAAIKKQHEAALAFWAEAVVEGCNIRYAGAEHAA